MDEPKRDYWRRLDDFPPIQGLIVAIIGLAFIVVTGGVVAIIISVLKNKGTIPDGTIALLAAFIGGMYALLYKQWDMIRTTDNTHVKAKAEAEAIVLAARSAAGQPSPAAQPAAGGA